MQSDLDSRVAGMRDASALRMEQTELADTLSALLGA
jgi:hypothetical protein